jgi:vacuolar-type H+-ATPase subunit I/STV1
MVYSAGVHDMCYNLAFDIVVAIVVGLIHLTFSIKGFFKKTYLQLSNYIIASIQYAKIIILDSIFGSFYQVMRD